MASAALPYHSFRTLRACATAVWVSWESLIVTVFSAFSSYRTLEALASSVISSMNFATDASSSSRCCMVQRNSTACMSCWPYSQALIKGLQVTTPGSKLLCSMPSKIRRARSSYVSFSQALIKAL